MEIQSFSLVDTRQKAEINSTLNAGVFTIEFISNLPFQGCRWTFPPFGDEHIHRHILLLKMNQEL